MKLSKIYSNQPEIFYPVIFNSGLNVILAEIRLPENRQKDTHNLGKTTLGRLLDFGLLAGRDKDFFLFKYPDLFRGFTFFLELQLSDNTYVTVRRSVAEHSKISFKRHDQQNENYVELRGTEWDHLDVPFERARQLLDSILNLQDLKPWDYRKGLGYLLRSQDDYRDVFQLRKFQNAHSDWKPFLAQLLGFDAMLIDKHYKLEEQIEAYTAQSSSIEQELGGSLKDASIVDGLLLLKTQQANEIQRLLADFDFRTEDLAYSNRVAGEIDGESADLNARRYSLLQSRKKIVSSLQDGRLLFKPDDAARLFRDAGVFFEGQIKKDFDQLIAFNRAITNERRAYLNEELSEIEAELGTIGTRLELLGQQRSAMLAYLTETDVFEKYKRISSDAIDISVDIQVLRRKQDQLRQLQELRNYILHLAEARTRAQFEIGVNVSEQNVNPESKFSEIRVFFSDIVREVINRKALLSVTPNQLGHLDYKAEILDELGNTTSAGLGHTYRKLLCIAFDLAVLRGHLDPGFPTFVFHDGALESLDDRKKENLVSVFRRYADVGIQSIVTLIDSDLPAQVFDGAEMFNEDEIVARFHDEDESGRLFRMRSW